MLTTTHDEFFGELTWQALVGGWEGRMSLPDGLGSTQVCIYTPDDERDQTITPEARAAFTRVVAERAAFARKAADDLLAVHNESWHHYENTPPLTSEQFQARLTLESIHIRSSGSATVYYDDGDLFWGHTIIVEQADDRNFLGEAIFEG